MMGYGTGAIMAVPAHDTRDLEFAEQFGLEIVQVVQPAEGVDWRGYVDDGVAVNSGPYDGLPTAEFKEKITQWLQDNGLGQAAVNYKLRDWLFSRQRYWGEPFPIVHCGNCGAVSVPAAELPLELPEMEDFTPAASDDPDAPPAPPLAKAEQWVSTTCPVCGAPAKREVNTMPQWAGSCWYYLRFTDPTCQDGPFSPAAEKYWMGPDGIDLYVGGAEHAVLHLLYARFWHKVLYDLGVVSTPEPFGKLFNQGMIRSFAYRDGRGVYVGYEDVDLSGDRPRHRTTGEELSEAVEKMSKSLKNVINPDVVIAAYGADTFRLYELFMGPLESSKPWNTRDVPGVHRFCHRVWRMISGEAEVAVSSDSPDERVERALHKAIKKVGEDIEAMKFNTAIAAMMEFVNTAYKACRISPDQARLFLLILAPFTPHLAEELWRKLGHAESLAHEAWPAYDPAMIAEETVELAVQVNGKVRGRIRVPAKADPEAVLAAAFADEQVARAIEGKTIVKKIVVPGRLVNLVVR
ncbi:MAG TPA: leucine--tRNA ligase, partial [Phycisphaerae bacterium]|nr:leucine--tRNA ligase [Phycisphaerae bacterium]